VTPPVTRRAIPLAPLILALALFAVPRLVMLTRYSPWQDELWTLDVVQRDFPTMLRWVVADQTHPPLFYALAWAWRRVGPDAFWWMRLLPALIGIGMAMPVVALCRSARLGWNAAVTTVVLCAASPWLVFYSVELRDYGLYAALAVASLAAWMRARDAEPLDRSPWRLLVAINIALVYSHYFGWLVIAAEGADALLAPRRRLVPFARSVAWTALAFAPWAGLVVRRAVRFPRGLEMVSWIPRPVEGDFLDPYRAALGTSPWMGVDLTLVVLAGGAIAWCVLRDRGRTREGGGAAGGNSPLIPLLLAATLPAVLTIAASVEGPRSMWVARYVLAVAPPFLVLLAVAITTALPARARSLAFAVALWPAALTVLHASRRDEKVAFDAITHEIGARDAAAPGTPVYALDYTEGGPLAWLAARRTPHLEVSTLASVDSVRAPRAWVVWNEAMPPRGPTPTARLIRQGYRVEQEFFVRGMDDSVVVIAVRRAR
jgi:hypothetical protein